MGQKKFWEGCLSPRPWPCPVRRAGLGHSWVARPCNCPHGEDRPAPAVPAARAFHPSCPTPATRPRIERGACRAMQRFPCATATPSAVRTTPLPALVPRGDTRAPPRHAAQSGNSAATHAAVAKQRLQRRRLHAVSRRAALGGAAPRQRRRGGSARSGVAVGRRGSGDSRPHQRRVQAGGRGDVSRARPRSRSRRGAGERGGN
eukprot:145573-Chlamydomonas_euryale.AAC.9